jgi:hypothetical protein
MGWRLTTHLAIKRDISWVGMGGNSDALSL